MKFLCIAVGYNKETGEPYSRLAPIIDTPKGKFLNFNNAIFQSEKLEFLKIYETKFSEDVSK